MLQYVIQNVKWKEIKKLPVAMVKKKADKCKAQYKICSKTVLKLQQQYKEYIQSKKKEIVKLANSGKFCLI